MHTEAMPRSDRASPGINADVLGEIGNRREGAETALTGFGIRWL